MKAILAAGDADQVSGHGSEEAKRRWQVVNALIQGGADPNASDPDTGKKPFTMLIQLIRTPGRAGAIAEMVSAGVDFDEKAYMVLVREWIDNGDAKAQDVVVAMIRKGGVPMIKLPVGYSDETVLDIAVNKLCKPIVHVAFEEASTALKSGGDQSA